MPDIDKINVVSSDSIDKLNAILKANIASVNGLIMISGVGEPAAAYSMRLLGEEVGISSYTGPAIRVRRTGDDVEADVAFDSGEITLNSAISNTTASETTFGDFVGHGGTPVDAFVDTWYDQSSNANHAEQATPGSQPQIYDATNGLITENGKPALDVANHSLETTTDISLPTDLTMFYVTRKDSTSVGQSQLAVGNSMYAEGFAGRGLPVFQDVNGSFFLISNTLVNNFSMTLAAQQKLIFSNRRGTTGACGLDGGTELTATASFTTGVTFNRIIGTAGGFHSYSGLVQEAIFYASDESDNRTGIEIDTNDYFLIDNFPSPTSGLLGTYTGAAAAYSVRKLANTASKSMRILVDSDANGPDGSDPTYDIGFNADGSLDVAAIEAYCNNPSGTNYDAYVVTLYDQSGEGNHATQSTFTACPKIADAGVVIIENGKPAIETDGNTSSQFLRTASFAGDSGPVSVFAVRNATGSSNSEGAIIDHSSSLEFISSDGFRFDCYDNTYRFGTNRNFTTSSLSLPTGQELQTGVANSSGRTLYIDGSSVATTSGDQTTTGTTNEMTLFGTRHSSNLSFEGTIQEVLLYTGISDGDQSDNRTAIEENINSEYLIYQPTDQPTSGFLYDYGSQSGGTDAAAAYSVRQLSDKAVIAMTIRRDMGTGNPGDDDETNIGWDANGDLDTQAIADFCGTGTGWVTRWWDQSVNGNHADQDAQGSQPQIYNGTAVITENGKPAIETAAGAKLVTSSLSATSFATHSGFVCAKSNNTSYASIMEIGDGVSATGRAVWIGVNSTATEEFGSAAYSGQFLFGGDATSQFLGSFIGVDGGSSTVFVDGTQVATATTANYSASTAGLGLAGSPTTIYAFTGVLQECILYATDQSDNRTGIETNINDYFSIYT